MTTMIREKIPAITELTPEEKYLLANELWEEIEANEAEIPIDDAIVELLEKRHQEYIKDPSNVVSWDEIKEKLKSR